MHWHNSLNSTEAGKHLWAVLNDLLSYTKIRTTNSIKPNQQNSCATPPKSWHQSWLAACYSSVKQEGRNCENEKILLEQRNPVWRAWGSLYVYELRHSPMREESVIAHGANNFNLDTFDADASGEGGFKLTRIQSAKKCLKDQKPPSQGRQAKQLFCC